MLSAEDAVDQRVFVVVGILHARFPAEEVLGELEHVVGDAVLMVVGSGEVGQLVGVAAEVFVVGAAACGIGSVACDLVPCVADHVAVAPVAVFLIAASLRQQLGQLGVDMQSLERVAVVVERSEHAVVHEEACGGGVGGVAGEVVELPEALADAANSVLRMRCI